MRTTLDIDKQLLEKAVKLSQRKTKAAAVNEALASYVRSKKIKGLLEMEGKIQIEDNWKELESLEIREAKDVIRRRR